MSPPGDDVAAEVRALRFWGGHGTVRLVDADLDRSATLLERLDGSRSLLRVPLREAVPVLAGIMLDLAVPAPHDVPSTNDLAAAAGASFTREWESSGRPTTPQRLTCAREAALRLATGPQGGRAANGDLHHEQVLAGVRAPWLVVDPVLLRGDVEYDLARVLWTRLDEMAGAAEVERWFEVVVDHTRVPRERARDWVVVRSMSYLLWGLPRGLTTDPSRCQRLLDIFG